MIEYAIFLHGLAQQRRPRKNEIWHNDSLGGGDDARTSHTCIAQRKRAIPHSTMKTHLNMSTMKNMTSVTLDDDK